MGGGEGVVPCVINILHPLLWRRIHEGWFTSNIRYLTMNILWCLVQCWLICINAYQEDRGGRWYRIFPFHLYVVWLMKKLMCFFCVEIFVLMYSESNKLGKHSRKPLHQKIPIKIIHTNCRNITIDFYNFDDI